jgi:hypothetical protein
VVEEMVASLTLLTGKKPIVIDDEGELSAVEDYRIYADSKLAGMAKP